MLECLDCGKAYPGELMVGSVCPICALRRRNATHGLPLNTPFTGEIAQSMYEQAIAYDRKRKARNAP